MNGKELNNIMTNLRSSYPKEYARFKKKCENGKISQYINKILVEKGYEDYQQILGECPKELNISYYLLKMIR